MVNRLFGLVVWNFRIPQLVIGKENYYYELPTRPNHQPEPHVNNWLIHRVLN